MNNESNQITIIMMDILKREIQTQKKLQNCHFDEI